MSDIFISYASEDRPRVKPIAKGLTAQGWSVWWDRNIPPGKTFPQVIQEAISKAKCVVVLWSKTSVESNWVIEEATNGKHRGILIPAMIDLINPPIGFGLIQAADLTEWEKQDSHSGFDSMLEAIQDIIGPPPEKSKAPELVEQEKLEEEPKERKSPVFPRKVFAGFIAVFVVVVGGFYIFPIRESSQPDVSSQVIDTSNSERQNQTTQQDDETKAINSSNFLLPEETTKQDVKSEPSEKSDSQLEQ